MIGTVAVCRMRETEPPAMVPGEANDKWEETILRRLNILHLLSQRPDSTGSGIYIQAMIREAAARGHRNALVAGVQAESIPELDCIGAEQCRFVRFGGPEIQKPIVGMSDAMPYDSRRFCDLSDPDMAAYEKGFEGTLTEAVRTFRPDIIHSHHLWIVTALARRLFPRIPLITTCHGSDLRQFDNCPNLRERVLDGCRRVDAAMALSRAQKGEIVHRYGLPPEKVHVVGAGYNTALFSAAAKPAPPPVLLAYAGKLSFAKGVPWFLRALAAVHTPSWHLHLVGGGSGAENAECLKMARRQPDRITVHGKMDQRRLAGIMKQSHIFVLPSFYEGLPLVVLEALACGCRIVTTDLPGITEIFGSRASECMTWVRRPRLYDTDKPYPEEESAFENRLTDALQRQMDAAAARPDIDLTGLTGVMNRYTWSSVFERVQAAYIEHTGIERRKASP